MIWRRGWIALAALLALLIQILPADARPPPDRTAALRRGINITGWFRYPVSRDPVALRAWLSDVAMSDLRRAGFSFVRLAVDPAIMDGGAMRPLLIEQIRRLQRHGLAVIVSLHPVGWNVDSSAADRARLIAFWQDLAPALRTLPAGLTFPEPLNEPVFHGDPAAWWSLQAQLHATIRAALPEVTIILTGQDWGSIGGLLALPWPTEPPDSASGVAPAPPQNRAHARTPADDSNVVYSFHFYDPTELTSLAAYRPGLDRAALAGLPFPQTGPAACEPAVAAARDAATRDLIAFYCATGWDAAHVRAQIAPAIAWAHQHDVALLAGEFGASAALNPAARLAWLRLVRETFAANGIGWALWGYDDVMGLAVARPPVHRPILDRSILESLGLAVL